MLPIRRSIADMFPYDVWLEIFSYFSFATNLGINHLFGSHFRVPRRPGHPFLLHLAIKTNFQTKCTLRLVSKEFKFLTSSIFYEVLVFKKWAYVADLLDLLDRDAHVREILSRSTRRIDLPTRTEANDESDTATVLLNACTNVTHLTCSFGSLAGAEFLEQMRTMGFGPRLQYLHLADSHVDMIIPYLQCFTNLEILLLSRMDTEQRAEVRLSTKVFMPKLRVLRLPHADYENLQDRVLEAPLLPQNGGYPVPIREDILWEEYGPQLRRLIIGIHNPSMNKLQYCGNLRSLILPLRRFNYFDSGSYCGVPIPKLESLVVTTQQSWVNQDEREEKMDAVFRTLSKLVEEGIFPSLKKFKFDVPEFRKEVWEAFPLVSHVWYGRFSSRGIQLVDSEGVLEPLPSEFQSRLY